MNELFGLVIWNTLLAFLALALLLAAARSVKLGGDRKVVVICSWILILGALLGLLATLSLRSLVAADEIVLVFGPPMVTLVSCSWLLAASQNKHTSHNDETPGA